MPSCIPDCDSPLLRGRSQRDEVDATHEARPDETRRIQAPVVRFHIPTFDVLSITSNDPVRRGTNKTQNNTHKTHPFLALCSLPQLCNH